MPFHSHEEEEREVGVRKELEFRYLQCNWETHTESNLFSSFQPSLETKARFTSLIFLNPSPPNAFRMQRESHAFNERFLAFFARKPHQKFLNILSN
jgi:hypothetical protein